MPRNVIAQYADPIPGVVETIGLLPPLELETRLKAGHKHLRYAGALHGG